MRLIDTDFVQLTVAIWEKRITGKLIYCYYKKIMSKRVRRNKTEFAIFDPPISVNKPVPPKRPRKEQIKPML